MGKTIKRRPRKSRKHHKTIRRRVGGEIPPLPKRGFGLFKAITEPFYGKPTGNPLGHGKQANYDNELKETKETIKEWIKSKYNGDESKTTNFLDTFYELRSCQTWASVYESICSNDREKQKENRENRKKNEKELEERKTKLEGLIKEMYELGKDDLKKINDGDNGFISKMKYLIKIQKSKQGFLPNITSKNYIETSELYSFIEGLEFVSQTIEKILKEKMGTDNQTTEEPSNSNSDGTNFED